MKEPLYVGAAGQESDSVSQETRPELQDLQSFAKDYSLFFVNTMHMYLRISVSLFELYAR